MAKVPDNDATIAKARQAIQQRELGYRAQALKMYPWVCGRCTREFTHANLHLLTVHHRDHDHDNNPSDGSNWELLCVYCHDEEHARQQNQAGFAPERVSAPATGKPFANLASLLKKNASDS